MSGMQMPWPIRALTWVLEKCERKRTPPECPYKTCPLEQCKDGCKNPRKEGE